MKFVTLKDICDISIGRTPSRKEPSYWGKGFPWVSISDLGAKYLKTTKEQITQKAVSDARCKLVKKGTLLFSFKLSLGKMSYAAMDLYTNEAIAALDIREKEKYSREYLRLALKVARINGGNIAAKGVTLNSKSLAAIQVPVPFKGERPDIEAQQKIAQLLSRVETLIEQRQGSIEKLDQFLRATFIKMFGDPVNNDNNWEALPFSKIGTFSSGGTPSKKNPEFWNGDFPWVSPKDMKTSRVSGSIDRISDTVFQKTNLKKVSPGSLLIVVRGMILAHSFPVATNMVDVSINQDMKAVKLSSEFDIEYVMGCMEALKPKILSLVTTAGHGTKKFDADAMAKLMIPKPTKKRQSEFSMVAQTVASAKKGYRQSLTVLQNLYNALSQQAFKGELDLSRLPLALDSEITEELSDTIAHMAPIAVEQQQEKVSVKKKASDPLISLFEERTAEQHSQLDEHLERDYHTIESMLEEKQERAIEDSSPFTAEQAKTHIDALWQQWLQKKGTSFDVDAFLQFLNKAWLEDAEEPAQAFGSLRDYEQIKQLVFTAIEDQKVSQQFDERLQKMQLLVL